MFEDIYNCHVWERGCYRYLGGKCQGCCSEPTTYRTAATMKYLDLNDHSAKAEKPCPGRNDSPPGNMDF